LKKDIRDIEFYFITDPGLSRKGVLSDVRCALRAGCGIVQYREKEKSRTEMIAEASKIKKMCEGRAIFLINDHPDIALAVDADGIHLGQDDMSIGKARRLLGDRIIGMTVHDEKEAEKAEKDGADYLGLSPIYPTGTKSDAGRPCGPEMITKVRKRTDLPIVALGGINRQNASEAIRAGADSVAAISAILSSDDVEKEVREFIGQVKSSRKK
jgi:thiamine-phosphate pyrophosphorylase